MSKIISLFDKICLESKEKIAFYYTEKNKLVSKTFYDVYNDAQKIANYLECCGVKSGDRILAFTSPDYKLTTFILAAFKIGVSIMYVDIFATQDKLEKLLERTKPNYVLVSNKTKYLMRFFKGINQIGENINIDKVVTSDTQKTFENVPENTAALLTTTTGTTDIPKIVIRSHEDLLHQLELIKKNIDEIDDHTVALTTSYIYVFANLLQGFTTVLPNINLKKSDSFINKKLKMFENVKINMIITSPDFCLKANNIYPNLKCLYFGGAILNNYEAKLINKKFNNSKIIYIYGCTECNLISKVDLNEYIETLNHTLNNKLGKIVDGVNVIIGDNSEILVSSEALTNNYDNKNIITSYEHDTHDRGFIENDELYYLGKSNTKIEINGRTYYSNQIEQELAVKYSIKKCAFLDYNGKHYLFIEDKNEISNTRKYLKEKYGIDVKVVYINKIPCDIKHHTKIDYKKLKEKLK